MSKKAISNQAAMAPVNRFFQAYLKDAAIGTVSKQNTKERRLGFMPSPIDLSHLKGKKLFQAANLSALPSAYDLRTEGRVSPVKDQGPVGTCWAFATYGSLESCLLPDESWDFSENNMKNLLSSNCPQGYDRTPDGGGNQYMSTAYLVRWTGPITESDDPYDPLSGGNCKEFSPSKHIQKVVYIPDRKNSLDNNNIKQAVMNYGAVFSTFYYEDNSYSPKNSSYYYNGSTYANHAICIVGWDDNYSRKNFNTTPKANGAFIAKNSWGSSWGDDGFFYISYYDSKIGLDNALFNNAESPLSYRIIHQYDPLGWVASAGYDNNTGWFANIYTSESIQNVQAVSWYAASPNTTYHLWVYTSPSSNQPRSGSLAKSISGTIAEPGYYSFSFKKPLLLTSGQKFSLVVQLTTPGYKYPIPIQIPIPEYSSKAKGSPGVGFISEDGTTWTDITSIWENTSICLKAFAN